MSLEYISSCPTIAKVYSYLWTALNGLYSEQIRRRSDYIIGFIAPAIGPNKSRKLTWLIAPAHNIRGKI